MSPGGVGRGTAGALSVAAGVVAVSAVVAAPQFSLPPATLGASLLVGTPVGALAAVAGRRVQPSRAFLALAAPLVALGVWRALAVPGVTRPAVLVAVAACAVAGTLTDRVTSR